MGNNSVQKWKKKKDYLEFLAGMYLGDMKRSTSWYIGGQKQRYQGQCRGIIDSQKWCFLVGCNNSGTSLLHKMLHRTGEVVSTEREGQYYTAVLERGHRRGYERVWTEFLNDIRMDENTEADIPRLVYDWVSSVEQPLKSVFLDKTTLNAVRMRWLQKAFPNSYFIGLVRNGYSVCEGIIRKGRKDATRAAVHWNLVNRIMMEDSQYIRNFMMVRYEDLVTKQEDTAKDIANFLGLSEGKLVETLDSKFNFETLDGKQSQGIKNYDQESIAKLSESQIQVIGENAKEMLTYFGYEA